MGSQLRSIAARIRALERRLAPELAVVRLHKLADDYSRECQRAQVENKPQPETQLLVLKIAKAGFRLSTYMALHNCLKRCRKQNNLPNPREMLLALIPYHWELVNRYLPRTTPANEGVANEGVDEEVEDRPWREWATAEAW